MRERERERKVLFAVESVIRGAVGFCFVGD